MKKIIFFMLVLFTYGNGTFAQMGIGTNNPDPSAMLDVTCDSRGFLMPRMTTMARLGITNPAEGLLVYDMDTHSSWMFRLGLWDEQGNSWRLTGNTGITSSNFIGTTDAADLIFRVNNQLTGKMPFGGSYLALGYHAGNLNTGSGNTAIGSQALANNTNGQVNLAIGAGALENQSFNNGGAAWTANNLALGNGALQWNQPTSIFNGIQNTALGHQVLNANTKGSSNTGVGYKALGSNTTASNNVAVGYNALYTQSFNNTGFTYSTNNTAIGNEALYSNQPVGTASANDNTALGYKTLYANTTGSYNIAIGSQAMMTNTTGTMNIGTGFNALGKNTLGNHNLAYGNSALRNNTTASNNIAIGSEALFTFSFSNGGFVYNTENIAIGDQALFSNQPVSVSTGEQNNAVGFSSLRSNTTGHHNTAVGNLSLYSNTTGYQNTAIGLMAFQSGSEYHNSTAVGYDAQVTADNQIKLGDENVTSLVCKAATTSTTNESPNLYVDNTGQISRSTSTSQVKMTSTGGVAIALTNASGVLLPKGTLVIAASSENSFTTAGSDSESVIGVLADNCSSGSAGWIIISGIAEVLVKDGTSSAAGNWVGASDDAGRAYFVNGTPGLTEHDREIGYAVQTVSSGTGILAKIVLRLR